MFLLLHFFMLSLVSQEVVTLNVIARTETITMSGFEREFIQLLINTHNKNEEKKHYSINFLDGSDFYSSVKSVSEATSDSMICAIRGITINNNSHLDFSIPYLNSVTQV